MRIKYDDEQVFFAQQLVQIVQNNPQIPPVAVDERDRVRPHLHIDELGDMLVDVLQNALGLPLVGGRGWRVGKSMCRQGLVRYVYNAVHV